MTNDIQHLPPQEPRVETGVVQFGEDWPGVFIRGDNAFAYRMAIAQLITQVEFCDPDIADLRSQ